MKLSILMLFYFSLTLLGQNAEVIEKLKMIEAGKIDEVVKWYNGLNIEEYEDASIKIIDAILTKDADNAVKKFDEFQKKYPKNNFAALALFRIYSYYYSIGQYSKAREYSSQLRKRFPNSVYIKSINESPQKDEKYDADILLSESNDEKNALKGESGQEKNYFIQVGAFSNIPNAEKLKKNLLAKKYKASLTSKTINGLKLNVVVVGNYKSLDDAERDLAKINKEFKVNGKIFLAEK